jgi:hypothetical protein
VGASEAPEKGVTIAPPATVIANQALYEAPTAAQDEPVLLGGVTATLDIAVWRRRWLWRLVASLVVRRFPG